MMKKYQSRETPIKGSSVSEEHEGYWADRIKVESHRRIRWFNDYGHIFYGDQPDPQSSEIEPYSNWIHGHQAAEKGLVKGHGCMSGPRWPPRGPIPQVRSDIRVEQENSLLTAPIGWYNYNDRAKGSDFKAKKMVYDYPTPGNIQKHHVVKDHVTGYSSSYGHHSVRFGGGLNKFIPSNACDDDLDKCDWIPFTPDGRVDLDKIAWEREGCSWAELQRRLYEEPPPEVPPQVPSEVCPKCCNSLGCICVPRRREKIPEDPGNGPDEELPPWPPQIWCGPSYAGSRRSGPGDLLRLRYRLSRDPDKETPMNRVYGEFRANNYYGAAPHSGEDTNICIGCCRAREAARGTWFDEQLRKGNPFTTGDTQFKSSAYIQKP